MNHDDYGCRDHEERMNDQQLALEKEVEALRAWQTRAVELLEQADRYFDRRSGPTPRWGHDVRTLLLDAIDETRR